uniref:Uncharacterized protein n=1 Tax=Timema bartmani TaxID=61472 RepID=A0A7R9F550_9NEOP|nr:unnamed protein product [Timema bartmani]
MSAGDDAAPPPKASRQQEDMESTPAHGRNYSPLLQLAELLFRNLSMINLMWLLVVLTVATWRLGVVALQQDDWTRMLKNETKLLLNCGIRGSCERNSGHRPE